MADNEKTANRKKLFLDLYIRNAANVTSTCNAVGIGRRGYYEWVVADKEFAAAVKDLDDSLVDMAESRLYKAVLRDNMTAIIFLLKTKGKKRGWVERQEVTGADGVPLGSGVSEEEERRLRSLPLDDLKRIRDIYRAGSAAAVAGGGGQDPGGEEPTRVH